MEVSKSMKRMIHIETCRNVLFIAGRRKALIKKMVWRVWSSDLPITRGKGPSVYSALRKGELERQVPYGTSEMNSVPNCFRLLTATIRKLT
jgi:hypothetical protein